MAKDKLPISVENKKSIVTLVRDFRELLRARFQKGYTLNVNSPESLKRNPELILRTIATNSKYLEKVPEDLLLAELQGAQTAFIDTAFKNGYEYDSTTPEILRGEDAKGVLIQYMQNLSEASSFEVRTFLEQLDPKLFSDSEFSDQITESAVEKGYMLRSSSPEHLKNNMNLAKAYHDEVARTKGKLGLRESRMITPELMKDEEFFSYYMDTLVGAGFEGTEIENLLNTNPEYISAIKSNPALGQKLFDTVQPNKLQEFFGRYFSQEELKDFFAQEGLEGKLARLSKLFSIDDGILESIDSRILEEQYQDLPDYKVQLIAGSPEYQSKLLSLDSFKYELYKRMTQIMTKKTDRWGKYDSNILHNLLDGYYDELVDNILVEAQKGNKITPEELKTLTFLFTKACSSKSVVESFDIEDKEAFFREKTDNIFNITTKEELDHYEEIREKVTDTVLANPDLDDEELTGPVEKHLSKFRTLDKVTRMKLALLEKYYNMGVEEAKALLSKFGEDLQNLNSENSYDASTIEIMKAIKNICNCDSIEQLQEVAGLDTLVKTDLSVATSLEEDIQILYENDVKKNCFMPAEKDKITTLPYSGKEIPIYDGGVDFAMVVKRIGANENDSSQIWNSLRKDGPNGRFLRFRTCTSYMTPENLLYEFGQAEVVLGFSAGMKDYAFDEEFVVDSHTSFDSADKIELTSPNSVYMTSDTLETSTGTSYNEIVVNTLGVDGDKKFTKLQPDYIVYIKDKSDLDVETMGGDAKWELTKKTASEFGVPIVVIDREKIRESQRERILAEKERLGEKLESPEGQKLQQQIFHYESRYGKQDLDGDER